MTKDRLRKYRDMSVERRQLENHLNGLAITMKLIGSCAPRQKRLEAISQRLLDTLQRKLNRLMEEQVEIETALDILESKERMVIRAYYIEGRKWDEVCEAVGYERSQVFHIHAVALGKLEQNHLLTGEKQD